MTAAFRTQHLLKPAGGFGGLLPSWQPPDCWRVSLNMPEPLKMHNNRPSSLFRAMCTAVETSVARATLCPDSPASVQLRLCLPGLGSRRPPPARFDPSPVHTLNSPPERMKLP